jgi:two-component system chemotaxis response regulator CheB
VQLSQVGHLSPVTAVAPVSARRIVKLVAIDDEQDMLEVYKEYCAAIDAEEMSDTQARNLSQPASQGSASHAAGSLGKGVDLRTFSDPQSALKHIKDAGNIDLVFVDFEMPRMNGTQFLAELRAFNQSVPSVLVSGHGGRSTFTKASGFDDMLAKPVDMASFEKCLRMFAATEQKTSSNPSNSISDAILIGASTGGPPLLESLLRNSLQSLPPILLVQHLNAHFSASFAKQLKDASGMILGKIDSITPLRAGQLYVSLSDEHLVVGVNNGQLVARTGGRAPVHSQCPAVDPLFESAAALQGKFHFL